MKITDAYYSSEPFAGVWIEYVHAGEVGYALMELGAAESLAKRLGIAIEQARGHGSDGR